MTYKVTVTEDVTDVNVSGNTTSINITGQQTEISVVNPALSVTFNPSQSFSSTNVQDALFEAHKMIGQGLNDYSVSLSGGNKFEINSGSSFGRLSTFGGQTGFSTNITSTEDINFYTDTYDLTLSLTGDLINFYDNISTNGRFISTRTSTSGYTEATLVTDIPTTGGHHHYTLKASGSDKGYIAASTTGIYLGEGGAAIGFDGGFFGGKIYPVSASGTDANGVTDLGKPTAKFKELYLANGIYFGADTTNRYKYEQGTWSPTLNCHGNIGLTISEATYVKNGNLVTVNAYLTDINTNVVTSGFVLVGGLPFQPDGTYPCIITDTNIFSGFSSIVSGITNAADNTVKLKQGKDTYLITANEVNPTGQGRLVFQCTYKTS